MTNTPFAHTLLELSQRFDTLITLCHGKIPNSLAHALPLAVTIHGSENNLLALARGLELEGKKPIIITHTPLAHLIPATHDLHQSIIVSTSTLVPIVIPPGTTIITPADTLETHKALVAAATKNATTLITLPAHSKNITTPQTPFVLGRSETLRTGEDCALIASGFDLHAALCAQEKLERQGITCTVLNAHTLPIDKHTILASAHATRCIATTALLAPHLLPLLHTPIPIHTAVACTPESLIKTVKDAILHKLQLATTQKHPCAQNGKEFILSDGKKIASIPELAHELFTMNDQTFTHHCNAHKNDFATWISDVFAQKQLAREITSCTNRIALAMKLSRAR